MSCNKAKLANNSRIYLTSKPNPTIDDWVEVKFASDITPQTDTNNMVDTPFLGQVDDRTQRKPGSRTAGDMTATITVQDDETNEGLEDAMAYRDAKTCIKVLITIGGEIDEQNGVADFIDGAYVTGVNLQPLSTDQPVTYELSIAGNAVSQTVALPWTPGS